MGNFKRILCWMLLLSALLPVCASNAKERSFPRLTFGVEGSYAGTFLSYRHSNFISNYGYRVDRKVYKHRFHSNGEVLLHIGYNVSSHVNLSLYSGYSGASNEGHIHPLSLRCTLFPSKKTDNDRWFAFLDAGPALKRSGGKSSLAGTSKIGGGYRLSITRSVKLDFIISLRQVVLKDIHSQHGTSNEYIDEDRIRRNNAAYTALTLGIGLTF